MLNNRGCILLILYSCATFTCADKPCGEQISDFLKCFDNQRRDQEAAKPKPISFEDFQKRISSCFTSNGCKDIQLESEENIEKRHNSPPSIFFADKLENCKSKTAEVARRNVEKCVVKSLPGFVLPAGPELPKKGVGLPITISWAAQIFIEIRSNATCPASANSGGVEKCVNTVFEDIDKTTEKSNPFENLLEYEGRVNNFCKADCFSKISNSCQKSLNESFPMICNCVVTDFTTNVDTYDKSFKDCLGPDAEKGADYKKNETILTVRAKLNVELCDRLPDNPCKSGHSFVDTLKSAKAQGGSGKERR